MKKQEEEIKINRVIIKEERFFKEEVKKTKIKFLLGYILFS